MWLAQRIAKDKENSKKFDRRTNQVQRENSWASMKQFCYFIFAHDEQCSFSLERVKELQNNIQSEKNLTQRISVSPFFQNGIQ